MLCNDAHGSGSAIRVQCAECELTVAHSHQRCSSVRERYVGADDEVKKVVMLPSRHDDAELTYGGHH